MSDMRNEFSIDQDLDIFRHSVERFLIDEMQPRAEVWRKNHKIDRESWSAMGKMGLLGVGIPEHFGGSGGDIAYEAVLLELVEKYIPEMSSCLAVHSSIVSHYLLNFASEEQKLRWLPKFSTGEMIGAVAMTEPDTGSDLRAIRTYAKKQGNAYLISGQKTFITNGQNADLIIVAAKSAENQISLFIVETEEVIGFQRGRHLDKIGMDASDTSELYFDQVKVPQENILGNEGDGLKQLMMQLPRERLTIAIAATSAIHRAIEITIEYAKERKTFGQRVIDNQHIAFVLADLKTEAFAAKAMIQHCIQLALQDQFDSVTASMAKYWATERLGKVVDQCLQIHGGNGYMKEYAISRMYVDARVLRIYGGTSEIMKLIIARSFL